jgi:membrane-associated protease RseP (regulator of RpoE activity)
MKKVCLICVLFLASCANPYAKFYQGLPDARYLAGYDAVKGGLQIYGTDDFDRDSPALIRRGYFPVGRASFNAASNSVTEAQLREQAGKIGAHAVLASSKYTHTITGAMPLTMPQTTTSYSTGTATTSGPGGTVNVQGSGMTTTYGSQTVLMPYSIARSDFGAIFFVKVRSRVGLFCVATDEQTCKRLQTNSGVMVKEVIEGSQAFKADILPGDVVLAVGNDKIQSLEDYIRLIDKYEGQTVVFRLDRDGKSLEKQIEILARAVKTDQ